MAEFQEVIKQFKRMCRYTNRSRSLQDCPFYCKGHGCNISHCRMLAFDDKKFANVVMAWAQEQEERRDRRRGMSDLSENNTVVVGGYNIYGEQKPRLIDANKCLANQYTLNNKSVEFTAGFHGALQFMVNRIENAPTVEAIPVEWIKQKQSEIPRPSSWYTMMQYLMDLWKEEQEGR